MAGLRRSSRARERRCNSPGERPSHGASRARSCDGLGEGRARAGQEGGSGRRARAGQEGGS
eukprot:6815602-Prymnesium_polylepis.1